MSTLDRKMADHSITAIEKPSAAQVQMWRDARDFISRVDAFGKLLEEVDADNTALTLKSSFYTVVRGGNTSKAKIDLAGERSVNRIRRADAAAADDSNLPPDLQVLMGQLRASARQAVEGLPRWMSTVVQEFEDAFAPGEERDQAEREAPFRSATMDAYNRGREDEREANAKLLKDFDTAYVKAPRAQARYAATALAGSADRGDRYCAVQLLKALGIKTSDPEWPEFNTDVQRATPDPAFNRAPEPEAPKSALSDMQFYGVLHSLDDDMAVYGIGTIGSFEVTRNTYDVGLRKAGAIRMDVWVER